ncbi:MAG: AraC family transcriptional regulator, partial [Pseudomonadota bacterium]
MVTGQTNRLEDVPRLTGSSIAQIVDRGCDMGLFEIEQASTDRRIAFDQCRFTSRSHVSIVERSDLACLVLTSKGEGVLHSEYDGKSFDGPVHAGVLTWSPTGVDQVYDFDGRSTNIATTVPNALFDKIRDQNPELANARLEEPLGPFTRPRLSRLVLEQNRLVEAGDTAWRSLADAQMIHLAVELLCLSADRPIKSAKPLSVAELDAVEDYVRGNLEINVTLDEVAALSGRPVSGFCRAFKASKGESFHRFALDLRLDEAARLLIETDTRLVDVAYATGFSSQSHLTSTMNRRRGITPG